MRAQGGMHMLSKRDAGELRLRRNNVDSSPTTRQSRGNASDAPGTATLTALSRSCHQRVDVEVSTTPIYDRDVDKPVEDMLKRAAARAEKSLAERNAAILTAFAEGASLREIGQAANMTHTAIKYIVDKAPNAEAVRAAREAQKARAKEPQNQ